MPRLFINVALYSVVALNLISTHVRGIRRSFSVVRDLVTSGKFFKLTHIQPTFKYAWEFVIHNLGKNVNYFHDEKASTV